jgi:16S rRNA (guanine527-N7)-methyltransferase
LTPEAIAALLKPYVSRPAERAEAPASTPAPDWPRIQTQLAVYLGLILKWNARINLTAIRTSEEIVRRHFGESLFLAARLGACETLLDFGSGAGFPGIPIQLLRPDVQVTLAESNNKKAAFLREVIRTLGLPTEVWADRVEKMPVSQQFDTVSLRAVDDMDAAVHEAALRATKRVLVLGTRPSNYPGLSEHFSIAEPVPLPQSDNGILLSLTRR